MNCDCLTCLPIDCSDARTMYKRTCPSCGLKDCPRVKNHNHICHKEDRVVALDDPDRLEFERKRNYNPTEWDNWKSIR